MRITKKLREQLRREWVEALESGKYKQGKSSLNDRGKFCCLGVACEIVREHFPKSVKVASEDGIVSYDRHSGYPPARVLEAIGLTTKEGHFDNQRESLAKLNDRGKSFEAIAKVIRSRPPGLFVD